MVESSLIWHLLRMWFDVLRSRDVRAIAFAGCKVVRRPSVVLGSRRTYGTSLLKQWTGVKRNKCQGGSGAPIFVSLKYAQVMTSGGGQLGNEVRQDKAKRFDGTTG